MNNTSFRDPSGFVFKHNNTIYRQINEVYKSDYEALMESGLYNDLTYNGLLISHKEVELEIPKTDNYYKTICPEQIDFISYPYEWCFSQLKDAALLTLTIQKIALKYNISLKDASGYNIQFKDGKPVFIDTLSFEQYKEGKPWVAYGQFCRHFLAPLALMSYTDINLNKLLVTNIDGIPLELCKKLLPMKASFNLLIFIHLILHASALKKHESDTKLKPVKISKKEMETLIDTLITCVNGLKFPSVDTEWKDYYNNTNYTDDAFIQKENIIKNFIQRISPQTVCDLGANRGDFSRCITKDTSIKCLSFDIDPAAIEKNYLTVKKNNEAQILPLITDLTNPSPAIGFANDERHNFQARFETDAVLALALIHHLSISNNLPFENTASFFKSLGKYLIIEFVPKKDSKVQILLSSREDIFYNYTQENFEKAYQKYYDILDKVDIPNSERTLYLMRRK